MSGALRSLLRATVPAFVLLLAACQVTPTESCDTSTITPARWRYNAVQEAPVRVTLEGTLTIATVHCGDLSGSLDIVATDAQGLARRLAGPVTGRVVSATAIRFDVDIDAVTRQHAGVIVGDSLQGSWISIAGSATSSGSFHSKREGGL